MGIAFSGWNIDSMACRLRDSLGSFLMGQGAEVRAKVALLSVLCGCLTLLILNTPAMP